MPTDGSSNKTRRQAARTKVLPKDTPRSDGLWTAAAQFANAASGLGLVFVAARVLAIDDFAALNWALSSILFLSALSRVGGYQAGTYLIASARPDVHRPVLARLVLASMVCSAAVSAGWLVISRGLSPSDSTQNELLSRFGPVVVLSVPAAAVLPVLLAGLRGLGDFRTPALLGDHVRRFAIVAALGVVSVVGKPGDPVFWVLCGALAAEVLAVSASIRRFAKLTPKYVRQGPPLPSIGRNAVSFSLIGLAAIAIPQGAVWLLSVVSSPREVAYFGLATRLAFAYTFPFVVGSRVYFPILVRAGGSMPEDLGQRLRDFATASTSVAVGLAIGTALLRPVFGIVFGEDLLPAHTSLILLAVGVIANTSTGLCMAVLSARDRSALVAGASAIAVIVYLLLVLVLGAQWGSFGAAIAAALAMAGLNGAMWLMAKSVVSVDTSADLRWVSIVRSARTLGGLR